MPVLAPRRRGRGVLTGRIRPIGTGIAPGRGPEAGTAGGPARHIPVLCREAVDALKPRDGMVIVDGTFGAGGYTRALLAAADCRVLAIDRDPDAVRAGADLVRAAGGRLVLVQGRFSQLDVIAKANGFEHVDGVVLDIGVSSMQLDEAGRGFSFRADAPLDMRMERDGDSAADLLAHLDVDALTRVLAVYGEERHARRLARAIVEARQAAPIATTRALADIAARVVPHKPTDIHPATRAFQALRIAVNDELGELARALLAAERQLVAGGVLAVVSFHSLEDRIVKTFLVERSRTRAGGSRHAPDVAVPPPTFDLAQRKASEPSPSEIAANPRSRSARLRAGALRDAPARDDWPSETWVPDPLAVQARRR